MDKKYTDYAVKELQDLCAVPSPSGYTAKAAEHLMKLFTAMGYAPVTTVKGTVMVDIGGKGEGLVVAAHIDTLGAMVRSIKDNGHIRPTTIGGFSWSTADGENCTLFTRDGRSYTGVILNKTPSVHVYGKDVKHDEENMEILLDENVTNKDEVKALGIDVGDFIAADPRTIVTPSGYIKSRFLDDKASASILIALAKAVADKKVKLKQHVTLIFTVYEEVGHGGAASIPKDTKEILCVDMGCIGDDLTCTERQVSICAKDSSGPYNYETTSRLVEIAKKNKIDYVIDVYPHYSSDAGTALGSGNDIRHGLIGPGVYASHNYERTHYEGMRNTLKLLMEYVQ